MKQFQELLDIVWSSTMDAQNVAMQAVENKSERPDLAAAYYRVASNRVADVDVLMKQAEACVDRAQADKSEDFQIMDVLWTADKPRLLKNMAKVKTWMEMYR